MASETKQVGFTRYAWTVLGVNIVVILWGVFLRASKSGDGCGQHWLTCNGEMLPSAPQLKTVIEYSHRVSSAIAFFAVLGLVIWAFRKFAKGSPVRKTAALAFVFMITEALVGAGLVLTGNTAENLTAARPFWMAGHLVNTFILLAFLTLTAWYPSSGRQISFAVPGRHRLILSIGVIGIFLVGITGSIAALSSMIFPSGTLAEGLASDFSATSNFLLRIRPLHPFISVMTAVYLIFASGWLKRESIDDSQVKRWSGVLSIVLLVQLGFGTATLLTLAPIVMQLGHLFLADAVWISYIMLAAGFLSSRSDTNEIVSP